MIIANPIYDVVFKYLLEDAEIARELLSTILGETITNLTVKPQETLVKGDLGEIKIFHLDFKAVIALDGGKEKTVLIELQKAKKSYDILRFRKYLGENYAKEEVRKNANGELESYSLEIVTIYILGFKLNSIKVPVAKVSRIVEDAITKEIIYTDDDFINHLTHESFTIQIPYLQSQHRNQLEEVLAVFSQENVTDDLHIIDYKKSDKNPLVKKMLRRLSKAAADAHIKKTMDAEDSIDRILSREIEKKLKEQAEKYNEELKQKDDKLKEKDDKLKEKDDKLKEKDDKLAELQKQVEELLKRI